MNFNQSLTTWYEVLCAPEGLAVNEAYADRTAINSVAIITGKSWQSLVRLLVEQAHFRCNLPSYKTCVTDMLRASGFKPITPYRSALETVAGLNFQLFREKSYIVHLRGGGYYALVPGSTGTTYVFKGCKLATLEHDRRAVDELWEYFPDTDNRTWISRKPTRKGSKKDSPELDKKNENPEGRLIGDCAIRTFATLLDCSWHDAMDILAQTSDHTDPCINSRTNINNTLKRLGFVHCAGIKVGKRYANGKEICKIFDEKYRSGERIYAQVGKRHCAAIVPTPTEGYKIRDTWDSTEREIIEYWVLSKNT